jgi:hypothetical protein
MAPSIWTESGSELVCTRSIVVCWCAVECCPWLWVSILYASASYCVFLLLMPVWLLFASLGCLVVGGHTNIDYVCAIIFVRQCFTPPGALYKPTFCTFYEPGKATPTRYIEIQYGQGTVSLRHIAKYSDLSPDDDHSTRFLPHRSPQNQ